MNIALIQNDIEALRRKLGELTKEAFYKKPKRAIGFHS